MKLYTVDHSNDPRTLNELIRDNTDPEGECHISDEDIKRISVLGIGESALCGTAEIKRIGPAFWEDPAFQGNLA